MGILLVYDVTDERSFNNIRNWIKNTEQYAMEGVNRILVGNKCDMVERRAVSREQAQALADEYGIRFIETSAKSAINVDEAFINLTKDIKKRLIDNGGSASRATAAGGVKLQEAEAGEGTVMDRFKNCCYK